VSGQDAFNKGVTWGEKGTSANQEARGDGYGDLGTVQGGGNMPGNTFPVPPGKKNGGPGPGKRTG